ncbi:HNH endonuclease [Neomoorella humiferrea]
MKRKFINTGEDTINNTVALCPNCHRRMHVLDLAADRERLRREIKG